MEVNIKNCITLKKINCTWYELICKKLGVFNAWNQADDKIAEKKKPSWAALIKVFSLILGDSSLTGLRKIIPGHFRKLRRAKPKSPTIPLR